MSIDSFRANFTINGSFVTEGDLERLLSGLRDAGYTQRTSMFTTHEDGAIAGIWYFTKDVHTVVLRAVPPTTPPENTD